MPRPWPRSPSNFSRARQSWMSSPQKNFCPLPMESHGSDSEMLQHCCGVLKGLLHSRVENVHRLIASNGLPVILSAMKRHSLHGGIQEQACVLLNIISNKKLGYIKNVVDLGGIPLLVDAIKKHSANTRLREHAADALINTTYSS